MDIRTIWEALSIGKVSLLLSPDDLAVVTFFWVCISLVHFIVGITESYLDKGKYTYTRRNPKKIWSSMYCIFYIPILIFCASIEFLIIIQCSVFHLLFWVSVLVAGVWEIVKLIYIMDEGKIVSMLGLIALAQAIGVRMTSKKLFFEDSLLRIKASYNIKQTQKRALK